jgi:hypothetical protein
MKRKYDAFVFVNKKRAPWQGPFFPTILPSGQTIVTIFPFSLDLYSSKL